MNSSDFLAFVDKDRRLNAIREAASPFMKRIPLYYTDHTIEGHSQRIITLYLASLLDSIAFKVPKNKHLNEHEMFVLAASAYLHDIGMISYLTTKESAYASKAVREQHQDLSYEIIIRSANQEPINGEQLDLGLHTRGIKEYAEWIALVAKGHRKTNLRSPEYDERKRGGASIRLRELAALLRLADELDKDYRRVPNVQELNKPWVPSESKVHWYPCHYVESVNINEGLINFSFAFPLRRTEYAEPIIYLVKEKAKDTAAEIQSILWSLVPVAVDDGEPRNVDFVDYKDDMRENDFVRLLGMYMHRRAAGNLGTISCNITEAEEEDLSKVAAVSWAVWPEAPENESWHKRLRSEYEKFREGFMVAKGSSGEVLGYTIGFPVKHEYIEKALRQELSVADMNGNAIETSKVCDDFWIEAVVRSPEADSMVGFSLAMSIKELLQSRTSLQRVGTISMSPEGHRLAAIFGFDTKWTKRLNNEYYRFCILEGSKLERYLKKA